MQMKVHKFENGAFENVSLSLLTPKMEAFEITSHSYLLNYHVVADTAADMFLDI